MTESLKKSTDYTAAVQAEMVKNSEVNNNAAINIKPAQYYDQTQGTFEPDVDLYQAQEDDDLESSMHAILKPKHSFWWRVLILALLILTLGAIAQFVTWMMTAWHILDYSALSLAAAGCLILVAGFGSIFSEWRKLRRLRAHIEAKETAQQLINSESIGAARSFCEHLIKQSALQSSHPAIKNWHAEIKDTHNDKEIMLLYKNSIQTVQDEQAHKEVMRSAVESALMMAISPFAIVDMAFVAWRNLRLINKIAAIYGIELGFYSRIRLYKLVLINVAFAGAAEVISDMGSDIFSYGFAAKISSKIARGMGVGLLSARLGIKTMALCRALPWMDDKPNLSEFKSQILPQLKKAFNKEKSS